MSKQVPGDRAAPIAPEDLTSAVFAFQQATELVDAAAARVLAVNRTDLAILGVLTVQGSLSAGELGSEVGLSPAATTAALTRLERAGHVTRARNTVDGRRTVVTLTDDTAAQIARIYGPIAADGLATVATYTESELAVIADFLTRGRELQHRHAHRIDLLTA